MVIWSQTCTMVTRPLIWIPKYFLNTYTYYINYRSNFSLLIAKLSLIKQREKGISNKENRNTVRKRSNSLFSWTISSPNQYLFYHKIFKSLSSMKTYKQSKPSHILVFNEEIFDKSLPYVSATHDDPFLN